MAQEICKVEEPPLRDIGGGHLSACHFAEEVSPLRERRIGQPAPDLGGSVASV
jgi:hypothetical protein